VTYDGDVGLVLGDVGAVRADVDADGNDRFGVVSASDTDR